MAVAILVWAGIASMGIAQFPHLPKIPSLPKKDTQTSKPSTSEVRPSRPSTYEVQMIGVVSSMTPDSAPPGGHGQVVMTGDKFKDNMTVEFQCEGTQKNIFAENLKVDSPNKAEFQITVPLEAKEGPCSLGHFDAPPGKEIFRISTSANMPIGVPSTFLGEGDLQFFDLMMKMQQAMKPGFDKQGESGRIELDSGSIKYVQGGKATFTESISGVKSMAEMKQGDKPIGVYRIVFNNGKIYNFMGQGDESHSHAVFTFLQKKLGK